MIESVWASSFPSNGQTTIVLTISQDSSARNRILLPGTAVTDALHETVVDVAVTEQPVANEVLVVVQEDEEHETQISVTVLVEQPSVVVEVVAESVTSQPYMSLQLVTHWLKVKHQMTAYVNGGTR